MDDSTISRTELQEAMADGQVIVVDGLPEAAFRRRHLPAARNLTADLAPTAAATVLPDRSAPIVAYSTDVTCTRGPDLVDALRTLGYEHVRLYADGIEDWVSAGLPIETDPATRG